MWRLRFAAFEKDQVYRADLNAWGLVQSVPVALSESLFILFYTDGTEVQPIRGLDFT